jgi:hypothetical protein
MAKLSITAGSSNMEFRHYTGETVNPKITNSRIWQRHGTVPSPEKLCELVGTELGLPSSALAHAVETKSNLIVELRATCFNAEEIARICAFMQEHGFETSTRPSYGTHSFSASDASRVAKLLRATRPEFIIACKNRFSPPIAFFNLVCFQEFICLNCLTDRGRNWR